ncbi:MAG TPA: YwiC-like family protein [Thermoanaerobaculia bacterium]|nr:YwiC-like family protein [Thermoanaerobaculia bacterium]
MTPVEPAPAMPADPSFPSTPTPELRLAPEGRRRPSGDDRLRVSLRGIAVPVEHGGWGIVFEPVVLGLLVAPSIAAIFIAIAAAGTFLARQPAKIALSDLLIRRTRYARTGVAARFLFLYAAIAVSSLALATRVAGVEILIPLLVAAPLAATQFVFDVRGASRSIIAELAGAIAMGATAGMMVIGAGEGATMAAILWGLASARSVTAIVYVRARLRLEQGRAVSAVPSVLAHLVVLGACHVLFRFELAPFLALVAFALLTLRASFGLSPWRMPLPPKRLGWREIAWGAASILLIAAGFRAGI